MFEPKKPCIYIVSGGSGASGEQVVRTVLAQFPDLYLEVIIFPHVRSKREIDELVNKASQAEAIIVFTLVDEGLNTYIIEQSEKLHVFCIDLMRSLLDKVSEVTGRVPVGHPGLYRKLHKEYFDRIAAIEFTHLHDDGKHPDGWKECEIMLIGVSRVGKTPLSLYLSVLGWKVANVPLIPDLEIPSGLLKLDHKQIIGLTMQVDQLLFHRQHRQRRLGLFGNFSYADPVSIQNEIEIFNQFFRDHSIKVIDVTNKPIETTADEVMQIIMDRFGGQASERV